MSTVSIEPHQSVFHMIRIGPEIVVKHIVSARMCQCQLHQPAIVELIPDEFVLQFRERLMEA